MKVWLLSSVQKRTLEYSLYLSFTGQVRLERRNWKDPPALHREEHERTHPGPAKEQDLILSNFISSSESLLASWLSLFLSLSLSTLSCLQ